MHEATAATEINTTATAEERKVPLWQRHDTIFGVCEAIGRDFGFNPNFLRVAVGSVVLFNPLAAVAIYAALGLAVIASQLLFPDRAEQLAEADLAPEAAANSEAEVQLAA